MNTVGRHAVFGFVVAQRVAAAGSGNPPRVPAVDRTFEEGKLATKQCH
jgi:hypothetical protein